MVLGGTFALADACKQSGLSEDVGKLFQDFSTLEPWILVLVLCLVTGILTNITSNTATATIFLPVVGSLVSRNGKDWNTSTYIVKNSCESSNAVKSKKGRVLRSLHSKDPTGRGDYVGRYASLNR